VGDGGNDRLEAGRKDDILAGWDGDDVLIGGGGGDSLSGGTGADTFILQSTRDSRTNDMDRIYDFNHSQGDLIDLSKIDADKTLNKDQAFHLGGSIFTHVAGELIQTKDSNRYLLQGDVNGDGIADFSIYVTVGSPLVGSDFIF
ncbi:MAG: hypothetical protein EBS42_17085, partial [Caulobacteraceae bacterium]|nr:hypothetical protein [Caulobacteraceae bacterium]